MIFDGGNAKHFPSKVKINKVECKLINIKVNLEWFARVNIEY